MKGAWSAARLHGGQASVPHRRRRAGSPRRSASHTRVRGAPRSIVLTVLILSRVRFGQVFLDDLAGLGIEGARRCAKSSDPR